MSDKIKLVLQDRTVMVIPVLIHTACPKCQGTGTISGRITHGGHDEEHYEHPCEKCKGSGWVNQKAFIEEL